MSEYKRREKSFASFSKVPHCLVHKIKVNAPAVSKLVCQVTIQNIYFAFVILYKLAVLLGL